MAPPLVVFEHVAKSYKAFPALLDVNFELYPGEIFGFIGPNGAGKTTTLKLLVGLLRNFQGRITVAGHNLPEGFEEVHKFVGFLPQSPGFQNWRTVDHALMTLGQLSGVSKQDLSVRVPALLERFDLGEIRHKKIRKLSGGTQQKVGFVQALLHKPSLVVLDEPLNNLDPSSRTRVKQIIRELKAEGATVIFSSHILSDVEDVADRIGIIQKGRMTFIGNKDQLRAHFGVPNDIQIEYAKVPEDVGFFDTLPDVATARRVTQHEWILQLAPGIPADDLVHTILVKSIEGGGRIRRIGTVALSLDELYVRYFENQTPAQKP